MIENVDSDRWRNVIHCTDCTWKERKMSFCPHIKRRRKTQMAVLLTVHLWGFSPVWRLMWTTSMYCALKGFCSREHSSQRHTNSFFSPWMWSLLMCCVESYKRSSLPDNKEVTFNATCTLTSVWLSHFTGFTHAPWITPSSITLDSYYASVNRT